MMLTKARVHSYKVNCDTNPNELNCASTTASLIRCLPNEVRRIKLITTNFRLRFIGLNSDWH